LASNSTAMETADVMTNSNAMGSKSIDWLTMMTIGIGGTDDKGGREEQIKGTTMTITIGDEGGDDKGGVGKGTTYTTTMSNEGCNEKGLGEEQIDGTTTTTMTTIGIGGGDDKGGGRSKSWGQR